MEDYITKHKLGLNVPALEYSCYQAYPIIIQNFANDKQMHYAAQETMDSELYLKYNFLMFPLPQTWELFHGIRDAFRSRVNDKNPYFVECWLNIYKADHFIDWHLHWPPEYKGWHGYYCVRGEGSITSYRLPNNGGQIDVENKVDQLVLGPSDGDLHRTWPWKGDGDRITIAFNIVPAETIGSGINHWIPI